MKDQHDVEKIAVVEEALRRWDPIGVIQDLVEDGLPPDEYNSYAPTVLSHVISATDRMYVANYLAQIRSVQIGLGNGKPTEYEIVLSEKLLEWKDAGFQKTPDFRFLKYTLRKQRVL